MSQWEHTGAGVLAAVAALALAAPATAQPAAAKPAAAQVASGQTRKPNILVIWGDDIGMWNVGAYTHGIMGRTPSIDSIARLGVIFTRLEDRDPEGRPDAGRGPESAGLRDRAVRQEPPGRPQ